MSTTILLLAAIALFAAYISAFTFPDVAYQFLLFWKEACNYINGGASILWFFVPQALAMDLLKIVIAMEVIYRSILLFVWIYNKIRP